METRYHNIRIVSILTALFIILALCGTASAAQLYVNETGWWNDGGSFNSSSTPIQFAINNASTDDTIIVNSGTYYENVDVNKANLTLCGNDTDTGLPVVDAMQADHAITISADGVTLDGFIATNATNDHIGIVVISENNVIVNNNASLNLIGILLENSNNNTLTSNDASLNSEIGIFLDYSDNNNLTDNDVNLNYNGIVLNMSIENNLISNTVNNNGWDGIHLINQSDFNNLIGNTANNNGHTGIKIYYTSEYNVLIDNTENFNTFKGIYQFSSDNNIFINNTANDNDVGIKIILSNNNTFTNTTANNNDDGIVLEQSSHNDFTLINPPGNFDWEVYTWDNSINNTFDIASAISFTGKDFGIKQATSPASDPEGYSYIDLGYINATDNSADSWFFINRSYSDEDVIGLNESSLKFWRYNSTASDWEVVAGTNGVNAAQNYVYANITNFSIFAAFAEIIPLIVDNTPPEVNITEPANLEIDVDIDTNISATFNESMNSSTLNNSTVKVYIQEEMIAGETFEDTVGTWNSTNFQGFIYPEQLKILPQLIDDSHRTIGERNITYSTHYVTKDYPVYAAEGIEVDESGNYSATGWLGEEYVVIDTGSSEWLLTNVIFEQNITDTKTLQIGESWDLGEGYSIRLREVDVTLTKAWMGLNDSSGEMKNLVVKNQSPFIVAVDLGGNENTPILVTYLSKVNNTSVQLKYTWFISPDVMVIYAGTDLIYDFRVTLTTDSITVRNDEDIGLPMVGTVPLFGDFMFEVEDTANVTYRLIRQTEIAVEGHIFYNSLSNTVTFDPVSNLNEYTDYFSLITTGAEDLAGNGLTEDYIWTFRTVDATPPKIISVTLNDTVVQTGAPIEVNVSATDEYGIDSVTADGTLLTLTDGYYVGTITASTSPVTVNVTDDAGNRATDTSATYTIDDTGPTISSVTLNDTVVKIGARIEVTVSATDDNGIDSVTADGTPLTLTGEYYVGTITAGTSPVTIIATDEADNLATDTSAAYTIDDIEPELILKLITKGNESTLYINSSEPLWNCTVNDEICLNSSLENWSYPLNKSGEYNIIGTDHAGNEALRNLTLETGEIEKTDYNQTNYTTGNGNVTLNITTNQDVNQTSNITICEYDENPVGSLNATTISLLGINKFVQIEVDDHLNDSIGTVRISINYSGANLSEIDEDSLKLYVWNNSIESWEELDPSENDKTNQTVWGKLDHLSIFGILGEIPEPEDVLDDGDEGYDGDDNGPSGGGGGASGELYENIVFSETDRQYITQNSDISYSFNLDCNIVQYVNFTGLTGAGRIATKVEILNDTSTLVDNPPSDIVYKNLNIWVGNAGWATEKNIDDATVVFTVEKSWVTDNNIDETTISLNRYSDNNWDKLVTRKVTEDSNRLYFEAETSGFSPFAVTGKKTMGESRGEGIIDPTVTAEKTPTPTETKGIPGFSLFAGLSILLIAVQLLRRKN